MVVYLFTSYCLLLLTTFFHTTIKPTGSDTCNSLLGALPASTLATYKPVSAWATCFMMLLTCVLGYDTLLHKTLQCFLIDAWNFLAWILAFCLSFQPHLKPFFTELLTVTPATFFFRGLGLIWSGWNTLPTELLMAGYFLSFRYQFKCHLFRELISGSH